MLPILNVAGFPAHLEGVWRTQSPGINLVNRPGASIRYIKARASVARAADKLDFRDGDCLMASNREAESSSVLPRRGDGVRSRLYFLYHGLSEASDVESYTLAVQQFHDHISFFAKTRRRGDSRLWPEVTFDDGHVSNIKLALPILEAYDFTAQFFITVGWTGKRSGYLDWNDLKILRDRGQQIGAHGWSHAFLTECTQNGLKQELLASRQILEDKLGVEITAISLPGGRYNRRVIDSCEEAGYRQVYTSVPEPASQASSLLVGRVNANSGMTAEDLEQIMLPDGRKLRSLKRRYLVKGFVKKVLTDPVYDRLWRRFFNSTGKAESDLDVDEDSARHQ